MSYLLRDPLTVLFVGAASDHSPEKSKLILSGKATELVHEPDLTAVDSAVTKADDVGCVVVDAAVPPEDVAAVCADVRSTTPLVPILVVAEDTGLAAANLLTVENCRLVPTSVPDPEFVAAVDDALASYERQRRHRAESSMLATLLEEAETSIFVKDTDARHLRLADVHYGYDPAEARGKTDVELLSEDTPEMAQRTYEDDLEVVETEEPIYEQEEKFDQGDYTHYSESTKVPWYDHDGDLRGVVGVANEVTDFVQRGKELEQQRQLNEQFTRYVSHDLRTPLQVASGALELARESGTDAAFDKVETTLKRMEETIEDLAELASQKAESDTFEDGNMNTNQSTAGELATVEDASVPTPRLAALVSNIWDVVGVEAATLDVALPAEATITAEEEIVRPLLENLIKNAQVHAGPEVTVTVGLTDDRGFFVADDGPGIPESEREAVFEEGYTTAEDGTGTGLHIVQEVAAENEWAVEATDAATGGCRIEVNGCLLVGDPPGIVPVGESATIDADRSIGDVGVEGTADYVDSVGRWILTGAGENIWGDTNEFHFAYAEATTPLRIQGRIVDLEAVDEYSKTGLMVRAGLDSDDPLAFVGQTASDGSELIWRMGRDSPSESTQLGEPDSVYEWYRVEYVDGRITCSLSPDGGNWTPVDQRDLDLGENLFAGLVVCSHDNRVQAVGEFEDVDVQALEL